MADTQVSSGELCFFFRKNAWMQTVVGTCVTVCIWDKENRSGGMCHYRLPSAPDNFSQNSDANDFGCFAIPNLLRRFKHTSSRLENLTAWVLGGAQLNGGDFLQSQQIGVRNISIAFELLALYGVPVLGVSIGSSEGRQVRFNPFSGEVDFRFVAEQYPPSRSCHSRKTKLHRVFSTPTALNQDGFSEVLEDRDDLSIEGFPDVETLFEEASTLAPDAIVIDTHQLSGIQRLGGVKSGESVPIVVISPNVRALTGAEFHQLNQAVGRYQFVATSATFNQVLTSALATKAWMYEMGKCADMLEPRQTPVPVDTVVLLGASTGGIDALDCVIKNLPSPFPPVCIVQHIPSDYSHSLAEKLNKSSRLNVCEAEDGVLLEGSHVYVAPGGKHLRLMQLPDERVVVRITDDPLVNGFRPSVDYLFQSALRIKKLKKVAALMTGMGRDGAKGLLSLKRDGAFTIAQDKESCAVYGMPRAAKELGAVCRTVPLIGIAGVIEAAVKSFQTPGSENLSKTAAMNGDEG
ncbi:Chemotaxis response regulator protein-glutamate methylesterase CheB [Grimontia indica]|uniref:Probable chemoreceptor glutamine deamidase CheD n=1 Tax=Grimontia indica TaxID=1056512 RepID=R1J063_9GAMM|nr:chemotaxis protein CheB [Grimontia indica]EOD80995.1 Chemotaxis response regulator protein-glutamate methylesterase CheB [Grimontia indica]